LCALPGVAAVSGSGEWFGRSAVRAEPGRCFSLQKGIKPLFLRSPEFFFQRVHIFSKKQRCFTKQKKKDLGEVECW
jgi:hypothetical protein